MRTASVQRSVQNMTSVDNCCRGTRPVVSQNVLTETQTCGWSSLFDKSMKELVMQQVLSGSHRLVNRAQLRLLIPC